MSIHCQCAAQQCARAMRTATGRQPIYRLFNRQSQRRLKRFASTDATVAAAVASNPKIASIVDQVAQLTLLETADLVASLKSRLNIPDMPMGGFVAAGSAAPAAVAEEPEEAAPKAEEKTLFSVRLESFDAGSKPKIIKEVKALLGLSLVDSKKFVESLPKVMQESVPKEDAEKIVETMKALGAVAKLE